MTLINLCRAATPASTLPAFSTSVATYPYISASGVETSDPFSGSPLGVWPQTSGTNTVSTPVFNHIAWQPTNTRFHAVTYVPNNNEGDPSSFLPDAVSQARSIQTGTGRTLNRLGYNAGLSKRNMQDYPSPQLSDISGPVDPTYPAFPSRMMTSPNMTIMKTPSISGSPESNRSAARDREPPRNVAGALFCNHPECSSKPPVFARKCEWRYAILIAHFALFQD